MPVSDILTRVASLVMLLSCAWNAFVSFFLFATMFWMLIGFFWLIPLAMVLVYAILAVVFMVTGHNKATAIGPMFGMVISVMNLNLFGFCIDFVALALMIGGYVARASENKEAELSYA